MDADGRAPERELALVFERPGANSRLCHSILRRHSPSIVCIVVLLVMFSLTDEQGESEAGELVWASATSVIGVLLYITCFACFLRYFHISRIRMLVTEPPPRLPVLTAEDLAAVGTLKLASEREESKAGGLCPICLQPIAGAEQVRELACSHCFHQPCIDGWVLSDASVRCRQCPICRADIAGLPDGREPRAEEAGSPAPAAAPDSAVQVVPVREVAHE